MTMTVFTVAVCAAIVALFLWALIVRIRACGNDRAAAKHHRFINATPSLLTGIGVFGTFTGIFLGLMDFDVARIDDSVPELLGGLKVAFATSVCGLLFSLLYRLGGSLLPLAAGGGDLAATFTAIREELEAQTKALVGDDDASLSSTLGKLRNELRDGFSEQKRAFQEFAETMAENNSKALIEALEEVIRDFNTKLNEQFGENFKQLNLAVHALLEWQERYKAYIEDAQRKLEAVQESLALAASRLGTVVEATDALPSQATALTTVVAQTRAQIVDLTDTLGGVAAVRERAANAFPEIEAALERVTTQMRASAEAQGKAMEEAVSQQSERISQSVREQTKALEAAATQQAEQLSTSVREQTRALEDAAGAQRDALTESSDTLRRTADEALARVQTAMEENFTRFDEEMQSEMTRALELMGAQLASMSGTFADDYRGFSDQIGQLIRSARPNRELMREEQAEFEHG